MVYKSDVRKAEPLCLSRFTREKAVCLNGAGCRRYLARELARNEGEAESVETVLSPMLAAAAIQAND